MTLPELIELKKKIDVYKLLLFKDDVQAFSYDKRFKL